MLRPELYYTVYLAIITVLTVAWCIKYRVNRRIQNNSAWESTASLLFIFLVISLFIGYRPISEFFNDMPQYQGKYDREAGMIFSFDWDTNNLIYDNLQSLFVSLSIPPRVWYVLMSFLYFGGIAYASFRLFPNDKIISFVFYLAAFSTFSYATNGIKAGVAASVFLVALANYRKPLISIFIAVLSYGFHHAMILPIISYIIVIFFKRDYLILALWLVSLLLAAAHVTYFQIFFAGITDEHGAEYLLGAFKEISGFRIDFILYSSAPIFIRFFLPQQSISGGYRLLWRAYTFANAVWLLCMYASYNNRIAYLSWFIYPFLLIFPFLQDGGIYAKYRYLNIVVLIHLSFTLFMHFIYYA